MAAVREDNSLGGVEDFWHWWADQFLNWRHTGWIYPMHRGPEIKGRVLVLWTLYPWDHTGVKDFKDREAYERLVPINSFSLPLPI